MLHFYRYIIPLHGECVGWEKKCNAPFQIHLYGQTNLPNRKTFGVWRRVSMFWATNKIINIKAQEKWVGPKKILFTKYIFFKEFRFKLD